MEKNGPPFLHFAQGMPTNALGKLAAEEKAGAARTPSPNRPPAEGSKGAKAAARIARKAAAAQADREADVAGSHLAHELMAKARGAPTGCGNADSPTAQELGPLEGSWAARPAKAGAVLRMRPRANRSEEGTGRAARQRLAACLVFLGLGAAVGAVAWYLVSMPDSETDAPLKTLEQVSPFGALFAGVLGLRTLRLSWASAPVGMPHGWGALPHYLQIVLGIGCAGVAAAGLVVEGSHASSTTATNAAGDGAMAAVRWILRLSVASSACSVLGGTALLSCTCDGVIASLRGGSDARV